MRGTCAALVGSVVIVCAGGTARAQAAIVFGGSTVVNGTLTAVDVAGAASGVVQPAWYGVLEVLVGVPQVYLYTRLAIDERGPGDQQKPEVALALAGWSLGIAAHGLWVLAFAPREAPSVVPVVTPSESGGVTLGVRGAW